MDQIFEQIVLAVNTALGAGIHAGSSGIALLSSALGVF